MSDSFSRREFLKVSAAGVAGASAIELPNPGHIAAQQAPAKGKVFLVSRRLGKPGNKGTGFKDMLPSISTALALAKPGDTIYVKGGDGEVYTENVAFPAALGADQDEGSGSDQPPIRLLAFWGPVTIEAPNDAQGVVKPAFVLNGSRNVRIRGLTLQDQPAKIRAFDAAEDAPFVVSNATKAVEVIDSHQVLIQNLVVINSEAVDIQGKSSNVLIDGLEVQAGDRGITLGPETTNIAVNRFVSSQMSDYAVHNSGSNVLGTFWKIEGSPVAVVNDGSMSLANVGIVGNVGLDSQSKSGMKHGIHMQDGKMSVNFATFRTPGRFLRMDAGDIYVNNSVVDVANFGSIAVDRYRSRFGFGPTLWTKPPQILLNPQSYIVNDVKFAKGLQNQAGTGNNSLAGIFSGALTLSDDSPAVGQATRVKAVDPIVQALERLYRSMGIQFPQDAFEGRNLGSDQDSKGSKSRLRKAKDPVLKQDAESQKANAVFQAEVFKNTDGRNVLSGKPNPVHGARVSGDILVLKVGDPALAAKITEVRYTVNGGPAIEGVDVLESIHGVGPNHQLALNLRAIGDGDIVIEGNAKNQQGLTIPFHIRVNCDTFDPKTFFDDAVAEPEPVVLSKWVNLAVRVANGTALAEPGGLHDNATLGGVLQIEAVWPALVDLYKKVHKREDTVPQWLSIKGITDQNGEVYMSRTQIDRSPGKTPDDDQVVFTLDLTKYPNSDRANTNDLLYIMHLEPVVSYAGDDHVGKFHKVDEYFVFRVDNQPGPR